MAEFEPIERFRITHILDNWDHREPVMQSWIKQTMMDPEFPEDGIVRITMMKRKDGAHIMSISVHKLTAEGHE